MTALYVTVWLLASPGLNVQNIANEAACHTLAVSLQIKLSDYKCRPYEAVVGIGRP